MAAQALPQCEVEALICRKDVYGTKGVVLERAPQHREQACSAFKLPSCKVGSVRQSGHQTEEN